MSAGPQYEYLWADKVKIKKPIKVSAPEYTDLLMTWVESQLNDEAIFPLQLGTAFPKNFQATVKTIFKRLFRIYAHIYHSHFQKILSLGAEAHLNTCFKHFVWYVHEFDLIDSKELQPMNDLITSMMVPAAPLIGIEPNPGPPNIVDVIDWTRTQMIDAAVAPMEKLSKHQPFLDAALALIAGARSQCTVKALHQVHVDFNGVAGIQLCKLDYSGIKAQETVKRFRTTAPSRRVNS